MRALFDPRDIVADTLADDDEELILEPLANRLATVRLLACMRMHMCSALQDHMCPKRGMDDGVLPAKDELERHHT